MAAQVDVFVDEDHGKPPTLYWLPELHKNPISHVFAYSSSCTTIAFSVILTSCLTAIKTCYRIL